MSRRAAPAALLIALVLPLAAPAQDAPERRYDVELVIIENLDTGAGERERWQPHVTVPPVEDAIALGGEGAAASGFEPLPPEKTRLGGAIERLEDSERYRVLRHLAWRQPAWDEKKALAVRAWQGEAVTVRIPIRDFDELYALEEAAAEARAEGGDTGEAAAADSGSGDARAAAPGADMGGATTFGTGPMFQSNLRPLLRPVEVHPLDGTVKVVVSRYLHVYTDLHFTTPVQWTAIPQADAPADAAADEGESRPRGGGDITAPRVALGPDGRAMLSYPFVQHRRMRSGELHYLDHPVLGMLIWVDRASTDDAEDTGTDEVDSGGA